MKKICIVTWFKSINYGTCLQAFALYKYLTNLGNDCYILKQGRYIVFCEPIAIVEELINRYCRRKADTHFVDKQYIEDFKDEILLTRNKIDDFVEDNLKFTDIRNLSDFKHLEDNIDYFVSGSDQLWNPNYFKRTTMLSFVKNKNKKIAYAGSFGVNKLPKRVIKTYRKLLSRYSYISVREKDGVKIVEDLIGRKPAYVLDPTMLLTPNEWEKCINIKNCKEERYLLCYFVGSNKKYWGYTKQVAEKLSLKIKIIPYTPESYYQKFDVEYGVGPKEFLYLIKNASLVCTDSFHAVVFCINFRKDFFVYKRFKDDDISSQNSRLTSLLNLLNLKDRMLDVNEYNIPDNSHIEIYENVHDVLDKEREKSQLYLKDSIGL